MARLAVSLIAIFVFLAGCNIIGSSDTYQSILDEYSEKLRTVAPSLLEQHNNETDAIIELSIISNEGMQKMAQLMQRNKSDYSEYEKWAFRLSDVYEEVSLELSNAFITASLPDRIWDLEHAINRLDEIMFEVDSFMLKGTFNLADLITIKAKLSAYLDVYKEDVDEVGWLLQYWIEEDEYEEILGLYAEASYKVYNLKEIQSDLQDMDEYYWKRMAEVVECITCGKSTLRFFPECSECRGN